MGHLAYNTESGEIVYSIPKITGMAGEFNWDFILRGLDRDMITTIDDAPDLTMSEAIRDYRIVDGQVLLKPEPILTIGDPKEGQPCEVILDFKHLLDGEELGEIQAELEGRSLKLVGTTLTRGVNIFAFEILGELKLKIVDERVQPKEITLEVEP